MTEGDAVPLGDLTSLQATWQSPEDDCSYLPRETSSLIYRQIMDISASEYERLLQRGWRRHGVLFFRPSCPTCTQCRSLRVPVASFRPSKSQRRCWRRNSDVRIQLTRPGRSPEHLELFNQYHADMQRRRDWPFREIDGDEYAMSFLIGNFGFAHELRFFRDDQMIGVGLVDITTRCTSSVYFYHDPAWRPSGPGVFSLLAELQVAAHLKCQYHYLGYWISECGSMAYKAKYRPHELLRDDVPDEEHPQWDLVIDD